MVAGASSSASGEGTAVDTEDEQRRRRKRIYAGVPIYPTTAVADGDEVVLVPALEDIPEAAAAPMPRLRHRTTAAMNAHTQSSGVASVPSSSPVVNPLNPPSAAEVDTEVCVGVVVPELTEEERSEAERRWYTQRDYGAAMYYSAPPAAVTDEEDDVSETDAERRQTSLTMSDLE